MEGKHLGGIAARCGGISVSADRPFGNTSALRNWRIKVAGQILLAALPRSVGDLLYHRLQARNGLMANAVGHLAFIDRISRHVNLKGASVVELGSGWYPLTPLLLVAHGVRSVDTYDLHQHYCVERVKAAALALKAVGCRAALDDVIITGELPDTIRYHPRTDLARVDRRETDLAVSRFVLEHVSPADLRRLHDASRQWLRGAWVHWISPSDHRAYSDQRLHPVDFLRYSNRHWRVLAGNRFAYHNRLRRSDYEELFAMTGWSIDVAEATINERARASLSRVPLVAPFLGRSPEDLIAGSLWYVLKQCPMEERFRD
jgi:hypothetical protein